MRPNLAKAFFNRNGGVIVPAHFARAQKTSRDEWQTDKTYRACAVANNFFVSTHVKKVASYGRIFRTEHRLGRRDES